MADGLDLARARGFVLDVDGCLLLSDQPGGAHGGRVLPGAAELVEALKRSGRRLVACTNGTAKTPAGYAAALRLAGLDLDDGELLTPASAAARHLARELPGGRVLVLGGEGVAGPVRDAGLRLAAAADREPPAAVLVGWAGAYATRDLEAACKALLDGARFLVTSLSPWFAGPAGPRLGVSSMIASGLEAVTEVVPTVVGKPSPLLFAAASELLGVPAADTVVVGDDPVAEVGMGRANGAATVLVLSGITPPEAVADLPPEQRPHLTLPDVGHLLERLGVAGAHHG